MDNAAYSMGLNFTSKLAPPFNGTRIGSGSNIVYTLPSCSSTGNGHASDGQCIYRRERPELVFADVPNGTHRFSERPLYLLNGVQTQCEGVPACEAVYGKCKKGAEIGSCAETISVTVATHLPQ